MVLAARQNFKDYPHLHSIKSESEFLRYFFAAWAHNHVEAQGHLGSDIALSTQTNALYIQDIMRDEATSLSVPS